MNTTGNDRQKPAEMQVFWCLFLLTLMFVIFYIFILSEAELACKGEADGYTYYVMNTIYCVFTLVNLKLNLFKF